MRGRLTRVAGVVMEAVGLRLPVGAICTVTKGHGLTVEAEVVGFANDRLFLMPVSETWGLTPGAWVIPNEPQISLPRLNEPAHPLRRVEDHTRHLPVGDALLGRVLDPNGKPLDRLGALGEVQLRPLRSRTINPIDREPIRSTLDVGIRAINALLCVGRGQRLGLFAGSGVGKSVLLGMMTRYTTADVTVVALIGERGREVKEFIDETLGPAGMARSIVVAAPADSPPLMRLQGAAYATAIAEYYRDQGKNVLLLMDSLTRYCMAQREIALAIGEPPATKGYPPSVFTRLPSLVERAGNGINGHGSITAFYTVLAEGDDQQDPIADHARAILDGHIVLSRTLAEQGHYPAIDIEQSVSRVMPNVADARHIEATRQFRQLYSRFQRNRDMINLGAYKTGADPILDQAILLHPQMEAFLQQPMQQRADLASSIADLGTLLGSPLSPAIPS
jgi:flagellum-specific ATP synthase